MKNIVCPVSDKRIDENIPRITAGFVISLLLLYVLSKEILIPAFLVLEFLLRSCKNEKYSLLAVTSKKVNEKFFGKGKLINMAPKIFAARLGLILLSAIVLFHLTGLTFTATTLSIALIILASLECVFNTCVGCYVFAWFVKPYFKN